MIRLLAPAKVNLTLRILGRREDGYHDIESLVQKISLYDSLTLERVPGPGIELACSDPGLPSGEENLAFRAARLILRECGRGEEGIRIQLEKGIPHGAGLGGGSSDAASVLMGLNALLELGLTRDRLAEMAGTLGSDVPLFLYPSPCVITGRGEVVRPSPIAIPGVYLLLFPDFTVSTQWAYSNFRLTKQPDKYTISGSYGVEDGLCHPDRWQDLLVNDLEDAVSKRYPEIGRCRQDLLRLGARASLMSGSGSTVYGIFENRRLAELAAVRLVEEGGRTVRIALPVFS